MKYYLFDDIDNMDCIAFDIPNTDYELYLYGYTSILSH
jgi:hypothetical protein